MVKKHPKQTTAEMYSVKQAAEKLKISEAHVRLLARQKKLWAEKLVAGRDWVVYLTPKQQYFRKRKPKRKVE